MNLGLKQIFTILATLFLSIIVPAQTLMTLPEDPAISKGVLPNGMHYYIVANPTTKGVADFALVQAVGSDNVPDSIGLQAVTVSRSALKKVKRMGEKQPQTYMTRHGAIPTKSGYVNVTEDATIFNFNDIRLNEGANVMDSTLMVLMDIADRANYMDNDFIEKWYKPADQAIIVSGDVDVNAVRQKLSNMSFMIPAGQSSPREDFVRSSSEDAVSVNYIEGKPLAEITATWSSQRPPRQYMNTVQAETFEKSLHTLGNIAVNRIRKTLANMNVPVADVSYSHICSSSSPYDDSFTISAMVHKDDAYTAFDAVTGVMASLQAFGAERDEFVLAESHYYEMLAAMANSPIKNNKDYVDKCAWSFLYNASTASVKERLNFHTSRTLPDTMRLRLFNNVAGALLDESDNQLVNFDEETTYSPMLKPGISIAMSDTLSWPSQGTKVKIKSTKTEPISGGSMWTFSNGFKVVYKKMNTDKMHYMLALNGGFGIVDGLQPGEGAYMADYLKTCNIAGSDASTFMNILNMEGLTMDVNVYMSNVMISGTTPSDRVAFLMRSLLALANQRTRNDAAFDYYKNSEYLALDMAEGGISARKTAIDSILCPNYKYSIYKHKGAIKPGFQGRAEAFWDYHSQKMNDGVLILVGNMNEDRLKKLLCSYIGGFNTTNITYRRPIVRYQPVSGCSTYMVDGISDHVDVAISTRLPLTADNLYAAELATMILKRKLANEFDGSGMYFEVLSDCKIYPEERFNLLVSISETSKDGYAESANHITPVEALADFRSFIRELPDMEFTDAELKSYKETLKALIAEKMKTPDYWVEAVILRYLDGKDFSTKYAAKIDALTASRVKTVLSLLPGSSMVEYVTIKK